MSVVKKQHVVIIILNILAGICSNTLYAQWPTNTRNDPFKVFSAVQPHYFLEEREKQLLFGMADEKGSPERVMIALSPFGQNADSAKTLAAHYTSIGTTGVASAQNPVANAGLGCNQVLCNITPPNNCNICINSIPIGDIDGRWNLLGLLAGNLPQGANFPPLLMKALTDIFPGTPPGDVTTQMVQIATVGGSNFDPCYPTFGYVSVPIKYRKKGIRWNVEAIICGDFGLQFEGGIVEISQVLNPCFYNLTSNSDEATSCQGGTIKGSKVNCDLFDPLIPLARELGMNLCNFTKWGFEDLYFSLYWRHAHVVNFNRDLSWARLLVIPFIRIGGGAATGHPKNYSEIFSLPFGNNGSNSINLNAGMNFDFVETVEIGAEVGYSHFLKKDFTNYRLPTNELQSGIYPFAADVGLKPGDTAYVAGKLAAYHFLDRLSFYFQWVYVHHRKDHIELIVNDPAFDVTKCPNSAFRVQLGNFGFNYDISPNFSLGFLWQQMFHVRNAYNSTTAMFTLNMIF
jgi:hypothetical protein